MKKLKRILASLLPGIFLIGYNVGTGSVTSMSKAGANFGLDLLWTVLISCFITYYLIIRFSQFTMVTGETIIRGIKEHIHPWVAMTLICALSTIILAALIGLMGILADVLQVWSESSLDWNVPKTAWALGIAFIVYLLLWMGNYAFFEKLLAVLVAIMGLAFLATMFLDFPSASDLMAGLVPSLPEGGERSDNGALVIVAGMVGTTVSVFAFIIRSQIIQEIGWKIEDDAIQRRDALVSASMMFLISAAVMITAASTLHAKGLSMNNVTEMIPLMEPIAGKAALGVFVIGILAAGLSSHLPNMLVIPWLIIDYRNEQRDTKKTRYRILLFLLSVVSIMGVILDFKPVFVLLLSQACIAIVLPLTIICLLYLTTKKELMKDHTNKAHDIIILGLVLIFSIYMSAVGISGLVNDLKSVF